MSEPCVKEAVIAEINQKVIGIEKALDKGSGNFERVEALLTDLRMGQQRMETKFDAVDAALQGKAGRDEVTGLRQAVENLAAEEKTTRAQWLKIGLLIVASGGGGAGILEIVKGLFGG